MKIAFDVDDTIWKVRIREIDGRKIGDQIPDFDLIQVLRWFANNGDEVFVWSAGGVEYSQVIVDKLGLTDLVKVIPKNSAGKTWEGSSHGPKDDIQMDIAFDDCETNLAKVDIRVKRDSSIEQIQEAVRNSGFAEFSHFKEH